MGRQVVGIIAGRHRINWNDDLRHWDELALGAGSNQRAIGAVLHHDLRDAECLQPLDRRLRARVTPQHGLVIVGRKRHVDAL
jgi:hypothetical protein